MNESRERNELVDAKFAKMAKTDIVQRFQTTKDSNGQIFILLVSTNLRQKKSC